MAQRLRRVSCSAPGLTRRRSGKGFTYLDAGGRKVDDAATLERIRSLVIPPAWNDVWICAIASGHIQATGVDARGRRQYRYHDVWREQRGLAKHDRILDFAARLPAAREVIRADLRTSGLTRERVLACAVRLLDLGFFRIGGEQYAAENETYGLATMHKEHVHVAKDGTLTFDYTAKSGKHLHKSLAEPEVGDVIARLKRRRGGGSELLAYRAASGQWVDVKSGDINAYLRRATGGEDSAKDFRTWSATVLAAIGLAVSTDATTDSARKRAVTRVVKEVSEQLGNTPAVCRSSYIDPRIIDLYDSGITVRDDLELLGEDASYGEPAFQGAIEAAVLRLLRDTPESALKAG
ncbi:MAG: DNA topoisomerase IB [Actinobacteria bacterium]|nr:DNA topoisomerase IB [Actinomycetota bacterium]MCA1719775.1 DNA topoisomerase IB [Actinomycetota bacterium]